MISLLLILFCSSIFFWGWVIGASLREKRVRDEANRIAGKAAANAVRQHLAKHDNQISQAIWQGQKEYLRIMIETVDSGLSIEQLRYLFQEQMEIVEQELAVEQTKEILI